MDPDAYKERIKQAMSDYAERQASKAPSPWAAMRDYKPSPEAKRRAATKRTLDEKTREWIEAQGCKAQRVDSYDARFKRSHDLMGAWDFLGMGDGQTIAVQTTTKPNASARVRKLRDGTALEQALLAGWRCVVLGWHKTKQGRWEAQETWL